MSDAPPRWNRTPIQLLEQQVLDLTAQLEQARNPNDLATMRDMLNRAGIKYIERPAYHDPTTVVLETEHGLLWFTAATRQLRSIT